MADAAHVLIVLSPYLLLPAAGWIGGRGARYAQLLAIVPAGLTAYFGWLLAGVASAGSFTVTLPWAPRLGLSLAFRFDGLGLFFALVIAGIGALIVVYAARYLAGHPLAGWFQLILFAFMGSMLGLVLSDNVLLLFVFWELTGFTSYFLIGFDHERVEARRAALQALLVTGAGGLALLAAGVMLQQAGGTPSLSVLRESGMSFAGHPAYAAIVGLVLLAAFTKSAQFPFHFWLPNAMEAPTPVSAYLHSATMVKAGVYLVARMAPLLGGTGLWATTIIGVAGITMLGASYRALVETDLKRILAYTTVAALATMMLLLGVGTETAIVAALLYLAAHACYKGALFLVAGSVDHGTGTRDVRQLGGLRGKMPATAAAGILAALSMAGVPPFFGFLAKEGLYTGVADGGMGLVPPWLLLGAAVAASAMMGAAGLTAGVSPFIGRGPEPGGAHESPAALWLAPLVLATLGVAAGLVPALAAAPVGLARQPVTGQAAPVHLELWHGFTLTLLLSAVTLALTLALYRYRTAVRGLPLTRALQTEALYGGTLAVLDSLSGRIAPALQSSSLRAYVRVIVITVVSLLVASFALNEELPAPNWRTPILPHELGVALLMIVGAIGAARARTAMAAVLSLASVGYGIALLYVLYGAPDLAATQFAVETLTVVLFVLVFYELRGFDDGSPRSSRIRDAVLAGASGLTIAFLVMVTASGGVTSRLADYFMEVGPALAHGRNVVNVILVDFRAFDTLGEITVLVTVAIGVRALLSIGKERL